MLLCNQRTVRAMTYRIYGALIASLGAVALMLSASGTFAASGAAHSGGVRSAHPISHPLVARSFRHHRRNNEAVVWPTGDGFFYGSPSGEPLAGGTIPGDFRNTNAYDIPWDWVHRYPPIVTPSDRPYVTSCPTETVTVPGGYGIDKTVNIMRCY
jgi:hypothetical protein